MGAWQWVTGVCVFLWLSGVVTGCGVDGNRHVTRINFPTAGASGPLYSVGAAVTHMWNENISGMQAAAQSSAGGIANINMVAEGEAQVSVAVSGNIYQAMHGMDVFEGHDASNIRAIAGLYLNPNQVVVSSGSGINQIADMKGKRIAVSSAGSSVYNECATHLSASGLIFPQDIKAEYISFSDAMDMLQNGSMDGAWIMAGAPASPVAQALAGRGRLLDMDEALIQKLRAMYPWYVLYTIPAGTYPKQEQDVHTTAMKMVMFTRADMEEETVYLLTKTLWEHMAELGKIQKNLKGLTPKEAVQDIGNIPLHRGAERYYREIGVL